MSNLHIVLWVIHQNHVCDLSIWVFPSSLMALSVRLIFSLCLTAGGFFFLVLPFPARCLGLPYGWLTTMTGRPCRGYCVPHIQDTSGLGALSTASRSGVLSYRDIACMPS